MIGQQAVASAYSDEDLQFARQRKQDLETARSSYLAQEVSNYFTVHESTG